MSPKLSGNNILLKRSEESEQEYGYILNLNDRYGRHKSKLVYDDDMNVVTTYYKYSGIPGGRYHSFVRCHKFVMWDIEECDREPENMVIFLETRKYIILDRDIEGVTVLDEHFKKVKIKYTSQFYSHFQQI